MQAHDTLWSHLCQLAFGREVVTQDGVATRKFWSDFQSFVHSLQAFNLVPLPQQGLTCTV